MSYAAVDQIARAVLYEGYLLYPYRPSALKNRQRWMFGRLYPRDDARSQAGTEAWRMQTECVVIGTRQTMLEVRVRFLQLVHRHAATGDEAPEQPVEREIAKTVCLDEIADDSCRVAFALPTLHYVNSAAHREGKPGECLNDDQMLRGELRLTATMVNETAFKLTATVENLTICGTAEQDLNAAMLSTHTILRVEEGKFVSMLDPPETYRAVVEACQNISTWPVLVGPEPGKMLLSAPIILYDYPQVAPESPGDLFDGTEIDELLTLRIQTLTDAEKHEMKTGGEQARQILERTESLTEEQMLQLHGRLQRDALHRSADRENNPDNPFSAECSFRTGDRIRLRPRRRADAFDSMLAGQIATVVCIEQDFENQFHLGVVLDEDPGKDFGVRGHPGHRFFYRPEEVERLPEE